jgi:hypothetical protein
MEPKKTALVGAGGLTVIALAWCVVLVVRVDSVSDADLVAPALEKPRTITGGVRSSGSEERTPTARRKFSLEPRADVEEDGVEKQSSGPRDPEASRARRQAELDELLRSHDREPIDPRWQQEFTEAVNSNLDDLSQALGFSTVDVDCRSKTCVATLGWPTFGDALHGWEDVLVGSHRVPCARQTMLPEVPDPAKQYAHKVIFTRCADRIDAE